MSQYSKSSDINAVLSKAEQSLILIEKIYSKSLNNKAVSDDLLVEIKDYFGNLKSSLDYLANKVYKNNFPICKTEKEFDNVTKNLKDNIKTIIKKWQPFQNNRTIEIFNLINNKYKHLTLIPQTKKEDIEIKVSSSDGGVVSWNPNGVYFGSGVKIMGVPIDPNTQMPIPNNIIKTEKITWVDFKFSSDIVKDDISVLPFLKNCFNEVIKIISELEALV